MSLLQEMKDYLKITWDSENSNLEGMISRGKNYLQDLTGTELNFEEEGQPKALLFDYCRYAYNNALEYYEENFQKEIVRLQIKEAIKASKEVVTDEG